VPKEAALFDLLIHSPALARGVYTLRAPLEWGRSMYMNANDSATNATATATVVCDAPQSIVAALPDTGCSSGQEVKPCIYGGNCLH
jgi:hypothetical protein